MKTFYQSLLLAIGALAITGTAYAQVPAGTWSGNDISDTATENTGMGTGALGGPTPVLTGTENTASGWEALNADTDGTQNTASGASALQKNTSGSQNTASGVFALQSNTTGSANTASGYEALGANTTSNDNTATGYFALLSNNGSNNTASGYEALYENTSGNSNNASGSFALHANTTGAQNSASGVQALYSNKSGDYNTASGTNALFRNTRGSSNIAEGYKAGYNLTTGSNNIDIGSPGVAAESGMIRIGTITGTTSTQSATYIAGIKGVPVSSGVPVVVGTNGQLGVASSSERFKTTIAPMGSSTAKLDQLRPVTFQYKSDPRGARQYGLIAEEVAKVYPELVVRDQQDRIISVRYDELAPMLLNEVQQLKQQLAEMHAALDKLQSKDERVAQR